MTSRSGRLQVLAAAVLFSTGGTAIKAVALTNWQVACGRSLLAALVILAFGGGLRRVFAWRPAMVGAAQAATLITFVTANKLTTAANAVFLQATAPFYIALLGPLLLGERLRRRDVPLLIAIFIGVLLLFAGSHEPLATAPHPVLGTLVGIASGLCWSLTVMGLRWLGRDHHAEGPENARAAAVAGNLIACLVCLPAAFPLLTPTGADLAGTIYLGVFQVGVAYLLLSRGMGHVPAASASLLLLAEPAFSPLWAWAFLRESPGFWPLVGGVLIIGAATTATWADSRGAAGSDEGRLSPPTPA
jgi:drug/metabolite transporter, DME family